MFSERSETVILNIKVSLSSAHYGIKISMISVRKNTFLGFLGSKTSFSNKKKFITLDPFVLLDPMCIIKF